MTIQTSLLDRARRAGTTLLLGLAGAFATAAPVQLDGTLMRDDDRRSFTLELDTAGSLKAISTGYASGGFDTMLFLFDAAGALIAFNDDGLDAVADPFTSWAFDAGLEVALAAGRYTLVLTQYDNVPHTFQLADGFSRTGDGNFTPGLTGLCTASSFCDSTGDARSNRWQLVIDGADRVIDEPGALALAGLALLAAATTRRRRWLRWAPLPALVAAGGASAAVGHHVESLSFPGADPAAVTLKITAPSSAAVLRSMVTLNGSNITALFRPDGGMSTMTATVSRLVPGTNWVRYFDSKASRTPLSELRIEVVDAALCNAARLGTAIDPARIGEPVSGVTLAAPTWMAATGANPAYCRVNGSMAPVDPAAPPINFAVALPSRWAQRAVQVGGGGMNGSIPGLTGGGGAGPSFLARGWVVSGSDSGHSTGNNNWSLNDESMKNLGYMQMKKTHDAAWVLTERLYGVLPRYSYWFGGSQGGREGLTVAQRYPNDYDGVVVTVPIVNYSSLMLSRALHRIQEIPLANWVTTVKTTAIAAYVIRQCDALDGLNDGIINHYQACRALFDVNQGPPGREPWAGLRCPGGVDPNPSDNTVNACLTDGQISTMNFVHTKYLFATPLAFGNRSFGMWVPSTDPSGNGLMVGTRYRGQEGAAANAPLYSWLGGPGVLGFLFKDLGANALDYVEGGALNDRRVEISAYLDATNPDLRPFFDRGGKLISAVGTRDSLASSGSQLDYYQSVLDFMGRSAVDASARLWVLPMTDHGLGGSNYNRDGDGNAIPTSAIPNGMDRVKMIIDWVEKGVAPPVHATVTSATRALPLCSYPFYPRYQGGGLPTQLASSYACTAP